MADSETKEQPFAGIFPVVERPISTALGALARVAQRTAARRSEMVLTVPMLERGTVKGFECRGPKSGPFPRRQVGLPSDNG